MKKKKKKRVYRKTTNLWKINVSVLLFGCAIFFPVLELSYCELSHFVLLYILVQYGLFNKSRIVWFDDSVLNKDFINYGPNLFFLKSELACLHLGILVQPCTFANNQLAQW